MAYASAKLERWLEAWEALDRVEGYGDLPAEHADNVRTLRTEVRQALLKDHAFVSLTVSPPGASVLRDGREWPEPRKTWTRQTRSEIRVSAPGYVAKEQIWTHHIGQVHRSVIRLKKPKPKPKPAVQVEKPKPAPVVAKPLPPDDGPSSLAIGGWTSVGIGVAAVAGGAVMFVLADGIASDLDALSNDTGELRKMGSYQAYDERFQLENQRRETAVTMGWVVTGVGLAAAVTGAVLLVMDDESEPGAGVAPLILPGGGGMRGVVRF